METKARSWALNGRFLTQPLTGVQRYGREILHALDRLVADRHQFASGIALEVLVPPGTTNLPKLVAIPIRTVGRGNGHGWEQLALVPHVRGGLISLCNTGPLRVAKHIVCIHDLNTRLAPTSYSLQFRLLYRALLPLLGRSAAAMTTVSQFSADQLPRFGIRRSGGTLIIPNGHEHALAWKPRHSARTRAAAGPNTVLLIGSQAPHKNIGLLLGMAQALADAGLRLAIAGASQDRIFAAHPAASACDNVVWLGRIDDDELAALMMDCLCLAFPSLTEGFGLPPLEAMALGCPVVASDRGALPEICGDAALYASPTQPALWLHHFQSIRDDQAVRAGMIARGKRAAGRFSWRHSAAQYLAYMAHLDGVVPAPNRSIESTEFGPELRGF
jgi:glycosyltransferase involved in cell wall biosynthesis